MNSGELLLRHAAVDARVRALAAERERLEAALAGDPRQKAAGEALGQAETRQREVAVRVRESEREVEGHRARLLDRDRELMSGRINNPTELTRLSTEVEHLRERVSAEEDAELALLDELEGRDAELAAARQDFERIRTEFEAALPGLRSELEAVRERLAEAEAEREAAWAAVPADYQAAARRVRAQPPVSEVESGACRACHVQLGSGAQQRVRRGELIACDNCGRVLVLR